MRRALFYLAAVAAIALAFGPLPARAEEPQITDPAGDFPLDFMDLMSVSLSVRNVEGRDYLDVTFTVVGTITEPSRALMPGYWFHANVGDCHLFVGVNSYPDAAGPAGYPLGSPHALCDGSESDLPAGYSYGVNTATVLVALGDIPQVVKGATLTNLQAYTALFHGEAEGGTISDRASTDKPWTIG